MCSILGNGAKEALPSKKPVVAPRVGVVKGKPHPSPLVLFLDTDDRPKIPPRGRGGHGHSKRTVLERATWNREEDIFVSAKENFEFLIPFLQLSACYLSGLLLHHLSPPPAPSPASFQQISDLYHREFPRSRPKAVAALKRRLNFVFKKKVGLLTNQDICLEECVMDMVGFGEGGRDY